MLTKSEVTEAVGIPPTTLQTWIERGIVAPALVGSRGTGNSHRFTVPQAVGIGVAELLRREPRGALPAFLREVIVAFSAMTESELGAVLNEGRRMFGWVNDGKPVLISPAQCDNLDWPDVGALYRALKAKVEPTPDVIVEELATK